MGQIEPIKPPLGGPELECSFAYRELRVEHLLKLIPTVNENGFVMDVDRVFASPDPDDIDPPALPGMENVQSVIEEVNRLQAVQVTVCFIGELAGLKMGLCITLRLDCGVAMVSVPEDMLWAFSGDPTKAEISRLKAYTKVCQDLARSFPPVFAHLDTEGVNPEELTVMKSELVKGMDPYDESIFDDEDTLSRLLTWYTEHNSQQWLHWT
jgi:hypothetical protein